MRSSHAGLDLVGRFAYDRAHARPDAVARRIATLRPDVLFVRAYVEDGGRDPARAGAQHVHLLASIGTSSSYCMPAFGAARGRGLGLFASDKPGADVIDPAVARPTGGPLLSRANDRYRDRYQASMGPPALAGFSASWALFHECMPNAAILAPGDIAEAALAQDLPRGGLPNGSGLEFGAPGTPGAGRTCRRRRHLGMGDLDHRVVWPPAFATGIRSVHGDRGERAPAPAAGAAGRGLAAAVVLATSRRRCCRRAPEPARPASAAGRHRDAAAVPVGEPPPDQASSNQQPSRSTQTVDLAKQGGSGYVFTPDGQARDHGKPHVPRAARAQGQTGV